MHLDARHFSDFFTAVHDRPPFPWQQRLASDLAESDEWPEVLDLPTGAGKTAALDVAVFHLALRADDPGRAALRIALVVDRRLVVDDAYAHAQKICKALEEPDLVEDLRRRNVLAEVAKRLAKLAERSARPLIAERLRGGAPLENEWTRTPTQPTILCSTVDQVGSRLLFRGYGVSHRMRPIHAGLLGQNTLILIDEAHIAQPFRQTVSAIRASGRAKVKVALLSATVGHDSQRVFRLSHEDRDNQTLRRRLEADKLARLEKVRPKNDPATLLAARAAEMMTRLRESGVEPAIVGVVVNRVQLARETFERLSAHEEFEALLMIGRCRTIERDRLVQEKLAPFKTGARGRSSAPSMVLVATQCIEVGVDLDVDGLVTQAAPLDSLRQRFGRLNRAGRSMGAEAQVVALRDDLAKSKVDSVYGDRIRATWDALEGIAEDKVVNFGIEALNEHLASMDVEALSSPRTSAPVLMPAYLDLWAQTSPVPAADPAVDLFLHGKQPPAPEVSLVWRGDISRDDLSDENGAAMAGLLSWAPPRASETVQVPLWAARRLLSQDYRDLGDIADVSSATAPAGESRGSERGYVAFRWAGRDDARTGPVGPSAIRPGDLLVLPSEAGGCDPFGWSPGDKSFVTDVADEAARPFRLDRLVVRVGRDVVRQSQDWERLKAALAEADGRDLQAVVAGILDALPKEPQAAPAELVDGRPVRSISEALEAMRVSGGRVHVHRPYPHGSLSAGGAVLVATPGSSGVARLSPPATEDDYLSSTARTRITLDDHSAQVESIARDSAKALGLAAVAADLGLAAYLHDAGKADRRFQTMLAGGDEWNLPDGGALAKSMRWVAGAWQGAGLPNGWRHEAQSVRLALKHPRFLKARDPELVLWLIGTHHGFGRPFYGFVEDEPDSSIVPCLDVEHWADIDDVGPQSLAFTFSGKGWPDLFESLKKKYGIWGLAHLETIVRLADHRASEGAPGP